MGKRQISPLQYNKAVAQVSFGNKPGVIYGDPGNCIYYNLSLTNIGCLEGGDQIAKLVIINLCVKPDCPDPCISLSKCPDIIGLGNLDNGRVLDAKALYVYADSNDYQRITDGCTFDSITALDTVMFRLEYLPASFRKAIYEKFRVKESEKGSPDYAFAKVCVNTIFGACAQKTIRDEYQCNILDDGMENVHHGWQENLESKTEDEVKKAQERKFPFLWGLWTASLSRLKLWNLLKIVGWEKVIYWDTLS